MQDRNNSNGLPAKYRIGLALSAALLVHALVLSGFPPPSRAPQAHRQSIRFELVVNESPASQQSRAAHAPASQAPRNPDFDIEPLEKAVEPASATPLTSRQSASQTSQPPEPATPAAEPQQPPRPTEQAAAPTGASRASTTARPEPAPMATAQTEEALTRITESPSEKDPYVIQLARELAEEFEALGVPAIKDLTRTVTMEIELQLMDNGALTRARIVKSTGMKRIDEAAYHASLAASPYPEPPGQDGTRNRFEVELVFSPKRF